MPSERDKHHRLEKEIEHLLRQSEGAILGWSNQGENAVRSIVGNQFQNLRQDVSRKIRDYWPKLAE